MAALAPILTDEIIDRVLRRAEHALSTLTPDRWSTINRVSAGAARQRWVVRCHADTGEARHGRS